MKAKKKTSLNGLFNFITIEATVIVIISRELVAERLSSLSSNEKRDLVGHKFKDNREVQTIVTQWLITQDTD
jgi:hypothetical protein